MPEIAASFRVRPYNSSDVDEETQGVDSCDLHVKNAIGPIKRQTLITALDVASWLPGRFWHHHSHRLIQRQAWRGSNPFFIVFNAGASSRRDQILCRIWRVHYSPFFHPLSGDLASFDRFR
jgi:hypothetical protein